jgi:nitronate monooxygenase
LQAQIAEEQKRYTAAAEVGDVARAVVWASEAIDLIRDLPPAAEIVQRRVSEASAALELGLALRDDVNR